MKSKLAIVGTTALLAGALAVPASADSSGSNGCVGGTVSGLAHLTQELFGLGLGQAFKFVELNPGEAIQAQVDACQT
jgi:hypothetical protein